MDRRRFLKYAGATTAIVGASVLGLDFLKVKQAPETSTTIGLTSTTSSMPNVSSTTLLGTTQTITSANLPPLELGPKDLGGYVFHDYNGNGIRDPNEPMVEDVEIMAQGYYNAYKTSPKDGVYVFRNLQFDSYRIYPVDDQNKFRYMCRSNADVIETKAGYQLNFQQAQRVDFALMEGFLTFPFTPATRYSIPRYYDWDPGLYDSLWWNGEFGDDPNNHIGIDYAMDIGNDIVAASPGLVSFVGDDKNGKFIVIRSGNLFVDYGHVSEFRVDLGQTVSRGQVIAKSGNTYNQFPHLHFQLALKSNGPGNMLLDPYRPIFQMQPKYNGYWSFTGTAASTSGQFWRWVELNSTSNPNLLNYWTRDNSPSYSSPVS